MTECWKGCWTEEMALIQVWRNQITEPQKCPNITRIKEHWGTPKHINHLALNSWVMVQMFLTTKKVMVCSSEVDIDSPRSNNRFFRHNDPAGPNYVCVNDIVIQNSIVFLKCDIVEEVELAKLLNKNIIFEKIMQYRMSSNSIVLKLDEYSSLKPVFKVNDCYIVDPWTYLRNSSFLFLFAMNFCTLG